MCGIAGYFCTDDYDPRLAIAVPILGMYMKERGRHSWGITNGTDVLKYKGEFNDSYAGQYAGSKQLLLHTRFGTVGELTAENSHPFLIGGILGVHNGQVYNHKTIGEKYGIEYKVDSEVIYHRIAADGDLSEIEAYGALVFFQDGIIHIGKFNGGQMVLVKTDWGWLWASTMEAVNKALGMSGLRGTAKFDVNLKEGKLYRLLGDRVVKDERKLDFAKQVVTSYSSTSSSWTSHDSRYSAPKVRKVWDSVTRKWKGEDGILYDDYFDPPPANQLPLPTAATTTFTAEPSSDYDDVVDKHDADDIADQYDSAGSGCSFCHEPLHGEEYIIIDRERVCHRCYKMYTDGYEGDRFADDRDTPPVSSSHKVYRFDEMTAEEAADTWRDFDLLQCDECKSWSCGDDVIHVEVDGAFAVCDDCYQNIYDEPEDEENVPLVSAGQCSTTETRNNATVRCVKNNGHADDCVDWNGRVIGNSITGVEDARADIEARESAPMPL